MFSYCPGQGSVPSVNVVHARPWAGPGTQVNNRALSLLVWAQPGTQTRVREHVVPGKSHLRTVPRPLPVTVRLREFFLSSRYKSLAGDVICKPFLQSGVCLFILLPVFLRANGFLMRSNYEFFLFDMG